MSDNQEMENTTTILLPAKLEMGNLKDIRDKMQSMLKDEPSAVVLDGGDVSLVDTAGVQLVVAFVQGLAKLGTAISWENYSVQVYQMANELGLGEELGD